MMALPCHHHHLPARLQYALALHLIHHLTFHRRKRKSGCSPPRPSKKKAVDEDHSVHLKTGALQPPSASSATTPQEALLAAAQSGDIKAAHTVYASTPEAQHSEITNFQDTRTGRTPLSVACERGRLGIVRLLMSKGADVYAYDAETSTTPLMWAAGAGHAAIAAILLAEGEADAFMPAVNGRFAALEAARNGHTACLELLLELGGIDVRQANDLDGAHPMLEAAAHGHLNALKVLLEAPGAKVNQTDKAGRTCLLVASRNGDVKMLEVLLQAGAKSIPEFVQGRTPLHEAALHGHLQAALVLIKQLGAASMQARDRDGKTAMELAGSASIRAALVAASQETG